MTDQRQATLTRQLQGKLSGNRIVAGAVSGSSVVSGHGFSLVRNGAGDYSVTFDTPFNGTPSVTVGMGATAAVLIAKIHSSGPATTTGFRIAIITPAGVPTDGEAHFTVAGP
jgi:hypothetical protein